MVARHNNVKALIASCTGVIVLLHASKKNKKLANLYMKSKTLRVATGKRGDIQLVSLGIKIDF
jgi:hypothetical protein